ncbi:MAG: hypothetical protein II399_01655, partial [Lachnospiraceae bacterium]|nr:hypothetical protein [Lachnospiraceae bacterium]
LTSMVQNGETGTVETPIEEPVQPKVYTTGSYRVTYPGGLRIREQATTGSPTLEILPKGYCAYVTEVKNEWGKIFCSYNGNTYDGWFCLTYTEKVSDLPLISSDVYDNGNLVFQEWYTSLTEAVNDSADSAVIVLHANCKITENLFLKEKQTIDMGPYEITASGNVSFCLNNGTVKSDKGSRFMNDNPFVSVKQVGGRYVYSSKTTCEPVSVSFGLSRLPKMRFKINIKSVVEGAEYNAVFSISDDASYESTGFTVEGNCVYISTPELPFDVLGDAVMVSPEIHKTINGIEYVSKEEPFLCNIPVVLSGQIWNGKFGDVAASLLNFVTEVQKTNGVNSSNYANRFLPSKKKVLGDVNIVSGNIPSVSFDNKSLSMIVEKSGDYDILLVSKEKSPLNSGQLKDSTYKVDLTGDKFIFSEFAVRNSFDTYYFTFAKYDGRQYICGETMEVIPISYISGDNSFIKAYAQYAGALSEYFG